MKFINIYLFWTFEKIVEFFPGINFSIFSDYEKLSILLLFNIFYCLFLFFVVWVTVKTLYYCKNFLSQFM